jgi:hypothetical protein
MGFETFYLLEIPETMNMRKSKQGNLLGFGTKVVLLERGLFCCEVVRDNPKKNAENTV